MVGQHQLELTASYGALSLILLLTYCAVREGLWAVSAGVVGADRMTAGETVDAQCFPADGGGAAEAVERTAGGAAVSCKEECVCVCSSVLTVHKQLIKP